MKKRLHELIEMAERGEKFEATHEGRSNCVNQIYFKSGDFTKEQVVAEWTVRMKREPRVIWVAQNDDIGMLYASESKNLVESFGKPIKFIVVLDE